MINKHGIKDEGSSKVTFRVIKYIPKSNEVTNFLLGDKIVFKNQIDAICVKKGNYSFFLNIY